jgi:Zn-dependent protease
MQSNCGYVDSFNILQKILIWAIPVILAITVHEVAHGWVANICGDPTAKMMGRLTLNPIKHMDLVGSVIVPVILLVLPGGFIFGWAKPVPVDWRNLKNKKRDMALVAAAGPVSNILMALLWAIVAKIGLVLNNDVSMVMVTMGAAGMMINTVLFVLNLIPIPPLDGSRIVTSFLSPNAARQYNNVERFGLLILLTLMLTGILGKIMWPFLMLLFGIIGSIVGLHTQGLLSLLF